MNNYRTYFPHNNIQMCKNDNDIYTREMAQMKKKELN